MDSKALQTMDNKAMMERIDVARFPQALTPQDKKMLAMVAITYGFDPLMGEITIYQGKPYVSIDGRYRKAQETGIFNGITSRPATKQEREEWGIPEGDYFVKSTVEIRGGGHFEGWGRVFKAETMGGKGYTPVEKNPQRMAEKRADAQALRKAFHINLPSLEEKGTPDDENVDVNTGEIIESKAVVVDEKKAGKDIEELFGDEPSKPIIDMVWLKESLLKLNWADCGKYLKEHYHVNGKTVSEMVKNLIPEQQKEFAKEVEDRLAMN